MADSARRSTAELVRDVADDLQRLFRKELELARTELVETVTAKAKGAGLVVAAAILAFPAVLFGFIALALWLPSLLPVTYAGGFAIVTLLMFVVVVIFVLVGLKFIKSKKGGISTSVDSIKEDVRWARDHLKP